MKRFRQVLFKFEFIFKLLQSQVFFEMSTGVVFILDLGFFHVG